MIARRRVCRCVQLLGIAAALVLVAGAPSGSPDDGAQFDADGGWRPVSVRGCALSLGYALGGIVSMPLNPFGGATVASFALHAALVFCT